MKLAPLSWNLLNGATLVSSAAGWTRGCPWPNLRSTDLQQPALARGQVQVVAGLYDRSDFTDSAGAHVATITPGLYDSVTEWAQALAAAHTAVGAAACTAVWLQGSSGRRCLRLIFAGGETPTLEIATGPNTARNALRYLGGFLNADRTAAATHTGDSAITCGGPLGDYVEVDLGSTRYAEASVVIGATFGSTASVGVSLAASSGVVTADDLTHSAYHGECMAELAAAPISGRYLQLRIREGARVTGGLNGACGWYVGPMFDTQARSTWHDGVDWEWATYSRQPQVRDLAVRGALGQDFVAEREPGETIRVAFTSRPGLPPAQGEALRNIFLGLGRAGKLIVALRPDTDPIAETVVCQLADPGAFARQPMESKAGRLSLSVDLVRCHVGLPPWP